MVGYDGLLELTGKLNQVTKLVNKRYHEGSNLVSKVQFFTISRRKIIKIVTNQQKIGKNERKKSRKNQKKIKKKIGKKFKKGKIEKSTTKIEKKSKKK